MARECGAALVTGPLHLEPPELQLMTRREFQHWLWQVGVLQRAFPNSTLKLDDLQMPAHSFLMLEAEPSLAAHVSQAELPGTWSADAGSGLADQVSSLSSLTKLTLNNKHTEQGEVTSLRLYTPMLHNQDPVLREAGVLGQAGRLGALRQLSALQTLHCPDDVMQTLLVNAVPRSWSLLTKLQLSKGTFGPLTDGRDARVWSLVEQQCPQLQALAMNHAFPLCLTALTSLTCSDWLHDDTDSFQCTRLGHLHVRWSAKLQVLAQHTHQPLPALH
eukprot:jgi/Astpho2/3282/Aster-08046